MTITDFGAVHKCARTDRPTGCGGRTRTRSFRWSPRPGRPAPACASRAARPNGTSPSWPRPTTWAWPTTPRHVSTPADALHRFGTGTYGSQAVGGFTALHPEELERTVTGRLIVVDSLFSADGDLPPLREISDLVSGRMHGCVTARCMSWRC